ncbi:cyclin-I [Thalassophryne amazonica]|uniref:cyclin-I n=1 Tax=Thalassophryne amazonica TaxID=390379 RepID=UPI00147193B7|nr:cyclin-I [Thalassophryne amazonica]
MKFILPWERQRLSFLLEKAASREVEMWKVYVPKKSISQEMDISPAQRDEAVRWLTELHRRLRLYPETLVLAVSILDRFLAPIKARPKYLRCIAIACFFLAAKTCEEDECVPSLKELAASSDCGCSPSEILRMERIILDKLNWDLHTATPLDFLHIFHAMVLSYRSEFLNEVLELNWSQHLALLTRRLYDCLADHTLIQFRGSMLALALISLGLETCCPDWLLLTIDLLKKAQMDSSDLIRSREFVARSLSTPGAFLPPNTIYIYHPLQAPPPCGTLGTMGSSRYQSPGAAALDSPHSAGEEQNHGRCFCSYSSSIPALLSPPPHFRHLSVLHKVTLRCKSSAKRKVEVMEDDDFYDGMKRLYNEDATATINEEVLPVTAGTSNMLSRENSNSSPCPPLQPC